MSCCVYRFTENPAGVASSDNVIICAIAVLVCKVAAVIPVCFADRIDPVSARRDE